MILFFPNRGGTTVFGTYCVCPWSRVDPCPNFDKINTKVELYALSCLSYLVVSKLKIIFVFIRAMVMCLLEFKTDNPSRLLCHVMFTWVMFVFNINNRI